MVLFWLSLSLY